MTWYSWQRRWIVSWRQRLTTPLLNPAQPMARCATTLVIGWNATNYHSATAVQSNVAGLVTGVLWTWKFVGALTLNLLFLQFYTLGYSSSLRWKHRVLYMSWICCSSAEFMFCLVLFSVVEVIRQCLTLLKSLFCLSVHYNISRPVTAVRSWYRLSLQ